MYWEMQSSSMCVVISSASPEQAVQRVSAILRLLDWEPGEIQEVAIVGLPLASNDEPSWKYAVETAQFGGVGFIVGALETGGDDH
jgi:hypothetical protein